MASAAAVIDAITAVIGPYLGPSMARAAVLAQAKKLGVQTEAGQIDPAQAEALLGRVGAGLNVFVGREKGTLIVNEARKAISRVTS